MVTTTAPTDIRKAIQERMDRFFATYHNPAMQKSATKALRFLATGDEPMTGKPEGWAAGIIYAVANRDRQACGVPGLLNADFAKFYGVSMHTVCRRAAQVAQAIEI